MLVVRTDLVELTKLREFYLGRLWMSIYLAWLLTNILGMGFHIFPTTPMTGGICYSLVGVITLSLFLINWDVAFGLTIVWNSVWCIVNGLVRIDYDFSDIDPPIVSEMVVGSLALVGSVVCLVFHMKSYIFWRRTVGKSGKIILEEV